MLGMIYVAANTATRDYLSKKRPDRPSFSASDHTEVGFDFEMEAYNRNWIEGLRRSELKENIRKKRPKEKLTVNKIITDLQTDPRREMEKSWDQEQNFRDN